MGGGGNPASLNSYMWSSRRERERERERDERERERERENIRRWYA